MNATAPPAYACPHCAERHARQAYLDLHIGRRHEAEMDAEERARFEAAVAEEDAFFVRLRRHIRSGFAVLPVFLFYVLSVVLLFEANGNPAFAVMLSPGFVAFSVLIYAMMFSRLALKEQTDQVSGPKEK